MLALCTLLTSITVFLHAIPPLVYSGYNNDGISLIQVVKALVSLFLLAVDYRQLAQRKKDDARRISWSEAVFVPLKTAVSTRWPDLAVLLIPSILYAGQNNLLVGRYMHMHDIAASKLIDPSYISSNFSMWPLATYQLSSTKSHTS